MTYAVCSQAREFVMLIVLGDCALSQLLCICIFQTPKAAWYIDGLPFLSAEIHLEGACITLVLLSTLSLAILTITRHLNLDKGCAQSISVL